MATNASTCPEEYHSIPTEELEEIQAALLDGDLSEAVDKVRKSQESLENAELHIAITGVAGAGKSTFVNVIRGLGHNEQDSAPTGNVETTTIPKKYIHPTFQNVFFWDLPGIGSPGFEPETYLKQVNFSRYDFFIIINSGRFTCYDALLAREIQKMGKNIYFVRSKIDNDLRASELSCPDTYDKNEQLQKIRENCLSNLRKKGITSAPVFLTSSFQFGDYDFDSLKDTLLGELDSIKRHAFHLSIPHISLGSFEKKKAALKKGIWLIAAAFCAVAAIPAPGLSFPVHLSILGGTIICYYHSFGLKDQSLKKLAEKVDKSLDFIKQGIRSPLLKKICKNMAVKMLTMAACEAVMTVESIFNTIPIGGSFIAGGISFATTYYILYTFLNELAEDAQRVLIRALHETEM